MTKPEKPGKGPATLDELREGIDALDAGLLGLLEQRFALTSRVAASKQGGGVFRPGREARLIRRLVDGTGLDALLVESLWRQIIAFSLAGQKPLRIALGRGGAVERTARFRFGVAAEYTSLNTASKVMDAVAGGGADIGILPHWRRNEWWRELAARRGRDGGIFITSSAPLLPVPGLDPVALLGPELPDASGKDTTLLHDAIGVQEKDGYDPSPPNLLGIIQQT